jgi:hypothetical protein
MTAIDRLIEEIQHLPDAENRRALLGRYGEISQRIVEATQRYRQATLALNTLTTLAPTEPQPDIKASREALVRDARSLRSFMEEGRVTGSSKRDESLVTAIDDKTKLCLRTLTDAWNRYFQARIAGYRQLADAADKAELPGKGGMQRAVRNLERLVQGLPVSEDIGQVVAAAIDDVHSAIHQLGVQGRAGQFLIEATGAGASPDMLGEPEVKQFLDTQVALKRLLKVKLA